MLRNLDPKARYSVTDLDNDKPATKQEFAGSELMEKGLLVAAPSQPSAVVITYRKSP